MSSSARGNAATNPEAGTAPFPAPHRPRLQLVPGTGGPAPLDEPGVPHIDTRAIQRLALYAFEVLEGTRSVAQFGGWITAEVADRLAERRALRTACRSLYRDRRRIVPIPGRVHLDRPSPHVIEAAVVLRAEPRSTAVALRLEYIRERWRATDLTVL